MVGGRGVCRKLDFGFLSFSYFTLQARSESQDGLPVGFLLGIDNTGVLTLFLRLERVFGRIFSDKSESCGFLFLMLLKKYDSWPDRAIFLSPNPRWESFFLGSWSTTLVRQGKGSMEEDVVVEFVIVIF